MLKRKAMRSTEFAPVTHMNNYEVMKTQQHIKDTLVGSLNLGLIK